VASRRRFDSSAELNAAARFVNRGGESQGRCAEGGSFWKLSLRLVARSCAVETSRAQVSAGNASSASVSLNSHIADSTEWATKTGLQTLVSSGTSQPALCGQNRALRCEFKTVALLQNSF